LPLKVDAKLASHSNGVRGRFSSRASSFGEEAYALIYEKGDYEAAITALRALDHDDNADVANLIGYASRKLGRYDDAKVWYERSLAADPNHAVTWSYYGACTAF
jgi:tetratricopeptide (TPR) repeat protein